MNLAITWLLAAFAAGLWMDSPCRPAATAATLRTARCLTVGSGRGGRTAAGEPYPSAVRTLLATALGAAFAASALHWGLAPGALLLVGGALVLAVGMLLIEPRDAACRGAGPGRVWRLPALVLGELCFAAGATGGAADAWRLALGMLVLLAIWLTLVAIFRRGARRGRDDTAVPPRLPWEWQIPLGCLLAILGAGGIATAIDSF